MSTNEHEHTAPDLASIESRLNALAESDRRAAPGSLEDRLFLSTRGALGSPGVAPAPITVKSWRSPLRLAAAVAVVAGAGLLAAVVFRSTGPVGTVATTNPPAAVDIDAVQSDLDDFLAMLDPADDPIVTLRSEIAATEEELDAFWASDTLDLNLSEDSL